MPECLSRLSDPNAGWMCRASRVSMLAGKERLARACFPSAPVPLRVVLCSRGKARDTRMALGEKCVHCSRAVSCFPSARVHLCCYVLCLARGARHATRAWHSGGLCTARGQCVSYGARLDRCNGHSQGGCLAASLFPACGWPLLVGSGASVRSDTPPQRNPRSASGQRLLRIHARGSLRVGHCSWAEARKREWS